MSNAFSNIEADLVFSEIPSNLDIIGEKTTLQWPINTSTSGEFVRHVDGERDVQKKDRFATENFWTSRYIMVLA